MKSITAFGLPNFPLVEPGDDLVAHILQSLGEANEALLPGDIIVVAQKVISKAEGRLVRVGDVAPSPKSIEIAAKTGKDPRAIEVILSDANEVVRVVPGLLIVEQKSGWICANAGVDRSNIEARKGTSASATDDGDSANPPNSEGEPLSFIEGHQRYDDNDMLALLPVDADASATQLRQGLAAKLNLPEDDAPAIIITDSHGRAWRSGIVGICIGCAGIPPVWDQRGLYDLFGYELKGSEEAIADELAAMAGLLMGASDEGLPVVIVRGFQIPSSGPSAPATSMQRPREKDLFR